MGIQRLEVRGDSNLAISQINGDFDAKDPKMAAYHNVVLKMSTRFKGLEFHHVARESNQVADVLSRIGAKRDPIPPNIFLERFFKPSVAWQRAAIPIRIRLQPQIPNTPTSSGAQLPKLRRRPISSWQSLPHGPNPSWPTIIGENSLGIKMRLAALSGARKPTRFTTENSTIKALPEYFKDVSLRRRGGSSWLKFMPVSLVTTPRLGPL